VDESGHEDWTEAFTAIDAPGVQRTYSGSGSGNITASGESHYSENGNDSWGNSTDRGAWSLSASGDNYYDYQGGWTETTDSNGWSRTELPDSNHVWGSFDYSDSTSEWHLIVPDDGAPYTETWTITNENSWDYNQNTGSSAGFEYGWGGGWWGGGWWGGGWWGSARIGTHWTGGALGRGDGPYGADAAPDAAMVLSVPPTATVEDLSLRDLVNMTNVATPHGGGAVDVQSVSYHVSEPPEQGIRPVNPSGLRQ